jgi:hypothetical protein
MGLHIHDPPHRVVKKLKIRSYSELDMNAKFKFRTPSKIEQHPSTIECGWCSYIENGAIKPA